MNILYTQSNKHRSLRYQIQTTIFEEKGTLFVKKQAASPAAHDHIEQIYKNDAIVKKQFPGIHTVRIISFTNHELIMEYLPTDTLQRQIEKAVLLKDFTVVESLFTAYVSVVKKLSQKKRGSSFLKPGLIDLRPSNIIIRGDKATIIDNEWISDEPLETDYILWRGLFYSSLNLQKLILYSCSEQLPCRKVHEYLYIPQKWWDALSMTDSKYLQYIGREIEFQNKVTAMEIPASNYVDQVVFDQSLVITKAMQNGMEKQIMKVKDLERRALQLEVDLEKIKLNNQYLQNTLQIIQSSKFYKLWQKFNNVKKIFLKRIESNK